MRHSTLEFAFRDYFQGQLRIGRRGGREPYVARAFRSTGDAEPMLAISTPLYAGGRHVGALVSRTRARATFGAVQMNCGGRTACMTALLGPPDRDAAGQALPTSLYVLAAPGLAEGQELMLQDSVAQRICAHLPCEPASSRQLESEPRSIVLEDFDHPVTAARSMAAFAPVGHTGLLVAVAAPHDALDAITRRMTDRLWRFLWVPLLSGLVVMVALLITPDLLHRLRALRARGARRDGERPWY